jgi:hypothetical protein
MIIALRRRTPAAHNCYNMASRQRCIICNIWCCDWCRASHLREHRT